MIILVVLLLMFFAIFFDIFTKFAGFKKPFAFVISVIIDALALLSGTAIKTVHLIISLATMIGTFGMLFTVILAFIAFILLHLGLGKLALIIKRR